MNYLLLTSNIRGELVTKLPGGGLEFGEGTIDCLKREFMEELHISIKVKEHLYTTDFFQISPFNKKQQILSIYYKVETEQPIELKYLANYPFDFNKNVQLNITQEEEIFRWIPIMQLTEDTFTLPIDKKLVNVIRKFII